MSSGPPERASVDLRNRTSRRSRTLPAPSPPGRAPASHTHTQGNRVIVAKMRKEHDTGRSSGSAFTETCRGQRGGGKHTEVKITTQRNMKVKITPEKTQGRSQSSKGRDMCSLNHSDTRPDSRVTLE